MAQQENRIRTEVVEQLLTALAHLDDNDSIYALLEDLCTPREIADMSQRLEVSFLLAKGVRYTEISAKTGASATTISRVSKCLNYGADGYMKAMRAVEKAKAEAAEAHGETEEAEL